MQYYSTACEKRSGPHLCFLCLGMLSCLLFWTPLRTLAEVSLHEEKYCYLLLIPVITIGLVYSRRQRIFGDANYSPKLGIPLLLAGLAAYGAVRQAAYLPNGLSVILLAVVFVWIAGFLLCYGIGSLRAAAFPLCFLILMIPIPDDALQAIVVFLQRASAETVNLLFRLAGVPFYRQDFKFLLPGVQIEIAAECSGIRSSLALFIGSLLTGYMLLQSGRRRAILSLATIPVVIIKNAVRIFTISCLGAYVDHAFLYGKLHRNGGLPFSLVAFALLFPLLFLLKRSEARRDGDVLSPVASTLRLRELPTVAEGMKR